MLKDDYDKLKELLSLEKYINYNGEGSKTKNIISCSITIKSLENIPVIHNNNLKELVEIALNELDFIVSVDQNIFVAGGMLHEKSHLNKYIINEESYNTFSKDLTCEYLDGLDKEEFIGTIGHHNSQHYRMVMRTTPLTFYDLNVPLATDYISKIANNLKYDDKYKYIDNDKEKKEYLSNIEMKAREAFIDPLTEITHSLNKGFNTPMVISLYDINTKTLPSSLNGTMAFIGRSECIYNVTQVEFINVSDVLHLKFNMSELNLYDNPVHDMLVMSSLLLGVANITNKKSGTVTASIGRVYIKEGDSELNKNIDYINLELNSKLKDVSEINSDQYTYEIK